MGCTQKKEPSFLPNLFYLHYFTLHRKILITNIKKDNTMQQVENITMAVVPQSFLNEMREEIKQLKCILSNKETEEKESTRIPKILFISPKTWQTYRDRRLIPFSQIGSKIYVRRSDLNAFMEKHYITARA